MRNLCPYTGEVYIDFDNSNILLSVCMHQSSMCVYTNNQEGNCGGGVGGQEDGGS